MHSIIQNIHQDHINFTRLLDVIAEQISILESGHFWDNELVTEIIEYLKDYGDSVHHPIENALYEKVLELSADEGIELDILLKEHKELSASTLSVYNLIKQMGTEDFIEKDDAIIQIRMFLARMKKHMDVEESGVLKYIEKTLSADALASISAEIKMKEDPVFSRVVDGEYARIRSHLGL
ncbi:MAG: hemerythrin domain-containing protein [bacterium]